MRKCFIHFGGELRIGGQRIKLNLQKYSPEDIIFCDNPNDADFIIMHLQYKHNLDFYLNNNTKPFIFLISELQQTKQYFEEFFSNPLLKMTYTFHPLEYLGYSQSSKQVNHVYAPWGYDEHIFDIPPKSNGIDKRDNACIAFSYYDSEPYASLYDATRLSNIEGKMMHLDIKEWDFLRQGRVFDSKWHWYTSEFMLDNDLKELYRNTKFANGMRSSSGFEVPVLESISQKCRPICFDTVYYRKFFSDFAVFVPEVFDRDLTDCLIPIFNNYDKYKVSDQEAMEVRNKFGWQTISTNFWKEVIQSL